VTRLARALARLGLRGPAPERLGAAGERAAARALSREGFRVLRRNERLAMGEIDLICRAPDRRTIVFVEVKTRRVTGAAGERTPEAQVGEAKRRKLLALAQAAARRHGWTDRPMRIDVVAVDWPDAGEPRVRRFEGAVTG
jgi:putative endonuclease